MSTSNSRVDFETQVTLTRTELNELLVCIERACELLPEDEAGDRMEQRMALWDKLFDAGQDAITSMDDDDDA